MDITIGSDTGFVTVVVNEGKVALLQLLVLIAQVEPHRVGQQISYFSCLYFLLNDNQRSCHVTSNHRITCTGLYA